MATSNISDKTQNLKAPLKNLDISIRLLTEFNLCMLASGKFRDGVYKSPYPLWRHYNNPGAKLPTVGMLQEWDRIYRPSLWGFVTGLISGITVFDSDSLETVDIFHKAGLEPHIKTRKGEHFYFTYPGSQFDHLLPTTKNIIPHIDIRNQGGFVNCLGSNSTASYKMLKSPRDLYDIKQLPKEVIEGIDQYQQKKDSGQISEFTNEGEKIPDGSQNNWLFGRACSYRTKGDTEDIIFQKLKLDLLRCPQTKAYPFTDTTLRRIAQSACKYKPKRYETTELIVRGGIPL